MSRGRTAGQQVFFLRAASRRAPSTCRQEMLVLGRHAAALPGPQFRSCNSARPCRPAPICRANYRWSAGEQWKGLVLRRRSPPHPGSRGGRRAGGRQRDSAAVLSGRLRELACSFRALRTLTLQMMPAVGSVNPCMALATTGSPAAGEAAPPLPPATRATANGRARTASTSSRQHGEELQVHT